MNIVFLDAYTLNPFGDFDISLLNSVGKVTMYDRTLPEKVVERAIDADIILTNKCQVNSLTISQLPKLKYIGVVATGFNIVDIDAAKKHKIIVSNVRGYSSASVAQLVFSLILSYTNQVAKHSKNIDETWSNCPDFCFYHDNFTDLENKTLGIVGLGDIGKKVAQIGLGFGMRILATRKNPNKEVLTDIRIVADETLFRESDFISLHCPLTTDNQEFINQKTLSLMKKTAFLINTSRGGLINEKDLANALNNDMIAGAGLDVLSVEPPSKNNPLFSAKNCIITPHVAWSSIESRHKLLEGVVENIIAFQIGKPKNVVNL